MAFWCHKKAIFAKPYAKLTLNWKRFSFSPTKIEVYYSVYHFKSGQ